MARRSSRIPSYRRHKSSGQAVVTIHGHDHYLGRHNTPESKQKYARLIQEWTTSNRVPQGEGSASGPATDLTINELALAFWQHATKYYVKPNGERLGGLLKSHHQHLQT